MATTPIVRTKPKGYWTSKERMEVCTIVLMRLYEPTKKDTMDKLRLQHQPGRSDRSNVEHQLGMVDKSLTCIDKVYTHVIQ